MYERDKHIDGQVSKKRNPYACCGIIHSTQIIDSAKVFINSVEKGNVAYKYPEENYRKIDGTGVVLLRETHT